MDDGGKGANTPRGQIISVAGCQRSQQWRLKEHLKYQFGLKVSIYKNNQLYIPCKSHTKFYNLISPFVVPSLRYKLVEPRND